MLFKLTDAQSKAINNCRNYSINYEDEALDSYETTGDDLMFVLEERARKLIEEKTNYTVYEDIGGICVYLKDDNLVAFYDYEHFVGTVF